MKPTRMWTGFLATGLGVGVIVALAGFAYGGAGHPAFAVGSVQVSLDCDTATLGIQPTCSVPVPASGARTVAVIATNNTGAAATIGIFNFDLFNPSCGGAGAPTHPQGTASTSGCTILAGVNGIFPNSNPSIAGTSAGFPNLVHQAGFAAGCAIGGDSADSGTGSAGTSTSNLSCFNRGGGEILANGASVVLGTETFTVDVMAATTIALTLSNVYVGNDNNAMLAQCDPAAPPPAPPEGVSGPCTSATLIFTGATATPTRTPTNTQTNTPTSTPTNTPTKTPTNTLTATVPPSPIQFKTCDPNETATNVGPGPTCNLFICQSPAPCTGAGEGSLLVYENVSNVQTAGNVGLGAYEFQVEFDNFVIQSVNPADVVFSSGGAGANRGPCQGSTTITSENSVRFGCVTKGSTPLGPNGAFTLAKLRLVPAADDVKDLFPGNDNGIPTLIKDNLCELADIFGHPVLGTVGGAGQLKQCGDLFVTIRILEGDINLDCKVDVLDEALIAQHYGAFFGSAFYQKWMDLEPRFHDLDIDIKDLQKVFGRDGSTCQNPIPAQTPVTPPFSLKG